MENEIQVKQKRSPWVPWVLEFIWLLLLMSPSFVYLFGIGQAYQGDISGSADTFLYLTNFFLEYRSFFWILQLAFIAITITFFLKRYRSFINIIQGIINVIVIIIAFYIYSKIGLV